MALGKNYEMAHQNLSEELTNSELYEEREQAIARLGETAMYLTSILSMFNEAQTEGNISPDLWRLNTQAQVDNIAATSWLIDVNRRIHLAGL